MPSLWKKSDTPQLKSSSLQILHHPQLGELFLAFFTIEFQLELRRLSAKTTQCIDDHMLEMTVEELYHVHLNTRAFPNKGKETYARVKLLTRTLDQEGMKAVADRLVAAFPYGDTIINVEILSNASSPSSSSSSSLAGAGSSTGVQNTITDAASS